MRSAASPRGTHSRAAKVSARTPDNPIETLIARGITLACAESLTGGGLAARIVNTAGVSAIFRRRSGQLRHGRQGQCAGSVAERLNETGPVDEQVALQMARGACALLAGRCPSNYGCCRPRALLTDIPRVPCGSRSRAYWGSRPSCCIFPVIERRYARHPLITRSSSRVTCEM